MTIIHDAYINALLADAAYVSDLDKNDTGPQLAGKLKPRMTTTLAKYIGDHFTVVTPASSPNSSFNVTVWKNNASSQLTVSMLGTQQGTDFVVDGDLVLTGNGRASIDNTIIRCAL
ncbi:hypothetical protein [Iodobacter fluviatilis]|uniref:Uncharacterized protein n=1 Tax=Iodobacter fluviatilis TaxID=537 RepID=A0A7G3G5K2_9NEIS|nr:hypothetical protein [Iodobacter fluviatilis]QBC42388.1 hypothetical protein C1H71_01625 [Iodobacter fluviatilis]